MARSPSEEIRERLTAKQVAEFYGYIPNRAGYICCPLHKERTASLKLYPGNGGWHCFGCGRGGDVIRFVMELFGIGFVQAVSRIDRDFGLGLTRSAPPNSGPSRAVLERGRAQRERRELEEQYKSLANLYYLWNRVRVDFMPVRGEKIHPLYWKAVLKLERLDGQFEELEEKLCRSK